MIRFQLSGKSPVDLNLAARLLIDHPRLNIESDSQTKPGRKNGYIRYLHARLSRRAAAKPRRLLSAEEKRKLAQDCWDHIVHNTDNDEAAIAALTQFVSNIERRCR